MQDAARYEKGLSFKEKRLLGRLKLTLFAVTIILFIHALPGRYVQEAFPLTRWAMFSLWEQYPLELAREFEVVVTDRTGHSLTTTMTALYTPLVGNPAALGSRIAITLTDTDDPATRAAYGRAIVERIRVMYGREPAEIELAAVFYAVDLDVLPHINPDAPQERRFMTRFIVTEETP